MSTASQHTDHTIDGTPIPTLDEIAEQHMALAPWVVRTPIFERMDFPTLEGTPVNVQVRAAAGERHVQGARRVLEPARARRNASAARA